MKVNVTVTRLGLSQEEHEAHDIVTSNGELWLMDEDESIFKTYEPDEWTTFAVQKEG